MGTLDLRIPNVREGSYFPSLFEPRRRSECALLAVVQQAYVEGISTHGVEDLVQALACDGISKSKVPRICSELDAMVESFLERPLDGGPYRYVWLDALTQKVRGEGASSTSVWPLRPRSTARGSARCSVSTWGQAKTVRSGCRSCARW